MNKKHERTKLILKIIGPIVAAAGLACTVAGFADMIISTNKSEMPQMFWLTILGLPLLGVGLMICMAAFRREIAKYVKNEAVPVINEAGSEITPAVSAVATAARAGGKNVCPHCGKANTDGAKFCRHCGGAIKTMCPHCKTEVADGEFCENCGEKFG